MLGAFRQPQGRMVIIRGPNSWRHCAPATHTDPHLGHAALVQLLYRPQTCAGGLVLRPGALHADGGGLLLLAALLPPAWPVQLPEGGLALAGPDGRPGALPLFPAGGQRPALHQCRAGGHGLCAAAPDGGPGGLRAAEGAGEPPPAAGFCHRHLRYRPAGAGRGCR